MSSNVKRDHHLWTRDTVKNTSGDITLDIVGDITLDAAGGDITLSPLDVAAFQFEYNQLTIKAAADLDDHFRINVANHGATIISTNDESGNTNGNLTFSAEGDITFNVGAGDAFYITATTKVLSTTFDSTLKLSETLNLGSGAGGSDTHHGLWYVQTQTDLTGWDNVYLMYLNGGSGKVLAVDNNANILLNDNRKVVFGDAGEYIAGDGTDLDIVSSNDITLDAGGHVEFDNCAVGFAQIEEAFSGDTLLTTGGTHDTQIDFRASNKIYLAVTETINDMNLIFPAVSGNFLLLVRYNGDWAIDSWKVWESDLSAATTPDVFWPGGTEPATTDSGRDIFSFYWDAEAQACYGVASLDFQVGD